MSYPGLQLNRVPTSAIAENYWSIVIVGKFIVKME